MIQTIDHVALLPAYAAAGTALLVLLVDLVVPRRGVSLTIGVLGSVVTGVVAFLPGERSTFCTLDQCSYIVDLPATVVAVFFAALTAGVLLLSARVSAEPGEYTFLLMCSMTGGVVLGASWDLITMIVALETLTLPLYVLVALRRRRKSAEGAVTFFVVSVVSTAIALLGAALLYASTGSVYLGALNSLQPASELVPVASVGVTLLVVGLAFKVAAVPLHGWAPATYDGAPLPVAAYLSTASKLGGVIALVLVVDAVRTQYPITAPVLAVLAVLTMTVGNLGALRQTRMVRLLAWSSIAQAGYALAALVVSGPAALAYTIFFVIMELVAFGSVIALRKDDPDGGKIDDYRGMAWRSPWISAALIVALAGLAGLPPGFAGLFAKITVVKVLLDGHWTWLAVVVALNAVLALAYYARVGMVLFARSVQVQADTEVQAKAEGRAVEGHVKAEGRAVEGHVKAEGWAVEGQVKAEGWAVEGQVKAEGWAVEGQVKAEGRARVPWPVAVGLAGATAVALVIGFVPQWALSAAGF